MTVIAALIAFGVMFILALLGVPLAAAMGLGGIAGMLIAGIPLAGIPVAQRAVRVSRMRARKRPAARVSKVMPAMAEMHGKTRLLIKSELAVSLCNAAMTHTASITGTAFCTNSQAPSVSAAGTTRRCKTLASLASNTSNPIRSTATPKARGAMRVT